MAGSQALGVAFSSLGDSANVAVGMHGSTSTQAALVTAVSTSAMVLVSGTAYGFATEAQGQWIITTLNAILVALKNKGIIASS